MLTIKEEALGVLLPPYFLNVLLPSGELSVLICFLGYVAANSLSFCSFSFFSSQILSKNGFRSFIVWFKVYIWWVILVRLMKKWDNFSSLVRSMTSCLVSSDKRLYSLPHYQAEIYYSISFFLSSGISLLIEEDLLSINLSLSNELQDELADYDENYELLLNNMEPLIFCDKFSSWFYFSFSSVDPFSDFEFTNGWPYGLTLKLGVCCFFNFLSLNSVIFLDNYLLIWKSVF